VEEKSLSYLKFTSLSFILTLNRKKGKSSTENKGIKKSEVQIQYYKNAKKGGLKKVRFGFGSRKQ